jgi:acetyl-CoA C-acetyltransferase
MDVAIIGIGIHPFGRTEGMSGLEQGAFAVRQALRDAGLEWKDMQFAFGGSTDAGAADTLVNKLGLTGLQFINVANGCATGGSALFSAATAIASGAWELGIAVGFDKHPKGAFAVDPEGMGLGRWYGEAGLALTTQFFAMKIQKYMHDYGITEDGLIRVAVKNFRNGSMNPNAWRRKAMSYEEIAASPMIAHPKLLILDEPSLGLAPLVVKEIGRIVLDINRKGTTILLVEQNSRMALSLAHRGYVLETGKIVLEGASRELMGNDHVKAAYLGG